jgi:hypothetical protein
MNDVVVLAVAVVVLDKPSFEPVKVVILVKVTIEIFGYEGRNSNFQVRK